MRSKLVQMLSLVAGLAACVPLAVAGPAVAPPVGSWWFEAGWGPALLHGSSADGGGEAANLGMGWTIAPHWALGVELAGITNRGGCELWECEDFGPDITHAVLVVEYAAKRSPWRLRLAAGSFEYCTDAWFYYCEVARGGGLGMYGTYHWPLTRRAVWSVGVRVGAEVARFPAKPAAQVPSFWHSAALLSVQLRRY